MPRLPIACALSVVVFPLAVAVAGCGGSGGASAATLKPGEPISMKSLRFHPDHVRVKVGETVTWRNDEGIPHDVVADSGATFQSKTFGKGGTYTWTPAKPGTLTYECTLHPGMTGTVDVVAK